MTRSDAHREIETVRPLLMSMALRWHRGNLDAAQDLVQDTVLKLLKVYPKYDGRSQFSTWACRVMFNLSRDQHRRASSRVLQVLDGSETALPCDGGLGEVETAVCMESAMESLPPSYKEVIAGASRGMSYDEIAEALSASRPSVCSKLSRARAMIRKAA